MPRVTRHRRVTRQKIVRTGGASDTVRRQTGITLLTLATFAVVFSTLEIISYTRTSATWEEPIHLATGYAALMHHDYRVDPEHPPFLRMWAALPLFATGGVVSDTSALDRTEPNVWGLTTLFGYSHRFLYTDNDADRLLYAGRFMIVMLGVLTGVLIFFFVREWVGFGAAAVALVFYTIEPNLAAHGTLVTTDLGLTCFLFGTVHFLWRTSRQVTVANVAGLVSCFVLAVVSKFTAIILGPIIVLLLACSMAWGRMTFRTASALIVLLVGSAYAGIWAIYGFDYAPSDSASWLYHYHTNRVVVQRVPLLATIVGWIDTHHLLPNVFSQGFLLGQAKAQARSAFLAGQFSNTGWWYYFPVAFMIKTPITAIILSSAGALMCLRRKSVEPQRAAFVLVPVVVYMAVAMTSHINIGLRHILPVYPFMIVLAAVAVRPLVASPRHLGRMLVGVLTLVWTLEFANAYPSTLAFFNQIIGGPSQGYRYLTDSNLDWGQDLKGLKAWMDRTQVSHINLAYFGSADPGYYGINFTYLAPAPFFAPADSVGAARLPGYVAVSATVLSGVYGDRSGFYDSFANREPVARIGHSILVYWVQERWW